MPAPKPEFLLTAFCFLAFSRTLYAIFIPIADCDETYNYWEPAHYLVYGSGKQTWEYAPEFALRSWLLVWIYAWPGYLLSNFISNKVLIYYISRVVAGLFSSVFETYFIGGIVIRFGERIARISLLWMCACAGFANSSTSFLPSTFAMYAAFVAGGAILRLESARLDGAELEDALKLRDKTTKDDGTNKASSSSNNDISSNGNNNSNDSNNDDQGMGQRADSSTTVALSNVLKSCQITVQRNSVRCIWSAVAGTVIGWPFAALSMLPFALLVLAVCRPFFTFPAREAAAALIAASVGVSILDSAYYCKRETGIFSTWNLVKYNVFSGGEGKGPELYGVEPWHFFFKNLFLNFNFVFPLALLSIGYSILEIIMLTLNIGLPKQSSMKSKTFTRNKHISNLILASPFVLWFLFWMRIPHKEERFMVPVYPFIVLPAAFFLGTLWTQSETVDTNTTTKNENNNNSNHSNNNFNTTTRGAKTKLHHQQQQPLSKRLMKFCCSTLLTLIIILNMSRSVALWRYYGESDKAASWLYKHIEQERALGFQGNRTICVGKDWFRMPPSYFAPENTRIRFVESRSFTGALPQEFDESAENPTCTTKTKMNDLNEAALGQSIALKDVPSQCDFVFDTTLGDGGKEMREAMIGGSTKDKQEFIRNKLKILRSGDILDAAQSPWYARVLYVPMWSERFAKWAKVVIATTLSK